MCRKWKATGDWRHISTPIAWLLYAVLRIKIRPLPTYNVADSLYLDFKHVHIYHNTPHQVKYKHCSILEILQNVLQLPKELFSEILKIKGNDVCRTGTGILQVYSITIAHCNNS